MKKQKKPLAELTWVRPPLQERSQQTLNRMLLAAESLINEVGFDKATVAEIAKRADSSVGAFYSRFSDKEGLLRCLLDRFVVEALATIDSLTRPELLADISFEEFMQHSLTFLMCSLGERRLFLQAITHLTTQEPELAGFREVLVARCAEQIQTIVEARGGALMCPHPKRGLRMVTYMCMSVVEAAVATGSPYPEGVKRQELVADMSAMVLAYLAIEQTCSERKSA